MNEDYIAYRNELKKAVKEAIYRKFPLDLLEEMNVQQRVKSRVLLGGLVNDCTRIISGYLICRPPEKSE